MGQSKLITVSTPRMSRPRAATSVASRNATSPCSSANMGQGVSMTVGEHDSCRCRHNRQCGNGSVGRKKARGSGAGQACS